MNFVMDCLSTGSNGSLQMGGYSLEDIAKEYGTPTYVMDEATIRQNCRLYTNAMKKYYDGNGLVLYASKALSCKALYRIAAEEGMGADVGSGGEIYTAVKAGFPADKIYFHGNNKTADELALALDCGVGRIVVDNITELELLNSIAAEKGKTAEIMFRIKPGIDAHTHTFIRTGQIDSKFGVALETGEADDIIRRALELENVKIVGLHCHIGSQIFELDPFKLAAKVMLELIDRLKNEYNLEIAELNLGGGYGIKYTESDEPIDYDKYIEAISQEVDICCKRLGINRPFILMEPGRSIVAPAGLTLYTVGAVKKIPDIRTYVSVDGGMGDNPRYILYGSEYQAVSVSNPNGKPELKATIAGKCCESGDILVHYANLPDTKPGDLLAVLATGAYNYSMASNYNRIPRPPIVMIKDKKPYLAVRRETYDDIISCDL